MGKTDDEIYDSDSASKNYAKRTKYTRLRSLNGQTVTRSQARIPQASNSENHTVATTHASQIQEISVDLKKSKNISTGKSKCNYVGNDVFPNEKLESKDENVSCCSAIFINQKQGKQSVLHLRNVDNTENVVTSVPICSKPRQTIKIANIKGEKYSEPKHWEHIVANSRNIFYYLDHTTKGQHCSVTLKQATKHPIIRNISELKPYKVASRFDRRVTALVWHPTNPTVLAVASKGGQIMLWNYEKSSDDMLIPGVGPGGAICAMKFDEENPTMLYTASVLGRVMIQDFYGKKNSILLDTLCSDNWFASLDVSHQMKLLMAGDCKGYAYLTNLDGENMWGKKKRLHKCKVTHIEFCPKQPSLMATSSVDHTVKLWDLRMLSDNSTTPLHRFDHEKGVNSAYFSLTNGASLLTTDQFNELRVYTGPLWNSETTILHPHRHFQHLTPIKAYWHPLEDIVLIGRYPHDDFAKDDKRTIDFYDGHSGNILHRLWSPDVTSIVSLSRFNHTGDAMASGMGFNTIIWKSETEYDIYIKSMVQNVIKQLRTSSRSTPSRRERRERENNRDRKEKKRLKQLIKMKT